MGKLEFIKRVNSIVESLARESSSSYENYLKDSIQSLLDEWISDDLLKGKFNVKVIGEFLGVEKSDIEKLIKYFKYGRYSTDYDFTVIDSLLYPFEERLESYIRDRMMTANYSYKELKKTYITKNFSPKSFDNINKFEYLLRNFSFYIINSNADLNYKREDLINLYVTNLMSIIGLLEDKFRIDGVESLDSIFNYLDLRDENTIINYWTINPGKRDPKEDLELDIYKELILKLTLAIHSLGIINDMILPMRYLKKFISYNGPKNYSRRLEMKLNFNKDTRAKISGMTTKEIILNLSASKSPRELKRISNLLMTFATEMSDKELTEGMNDEAPPERAEEPTSEDLSSTLNKDEVVQSKSESDDENPPSPDASKVGEAMGDQMDESSVNMSSEYLKDEMDEVLNFSSDSTNSSENYKMLKSLLGENFVSKE